MSQTVPKRKKERGSSMVEFALGGTVMVLLFTGTFQFGYAFYKYNTLAASVRSAAQYASMKAYDSNSATPSNTFKTAVQNMVVYGTPAPGENASTILPSLRTSDVTVAATFVNSVPTAVTVGVSSYSLNALFRSYNLSNKPSVTFPYVGRFAPP